MVNMVPDYSDRSNCEAALDEPPIPVLEDLPSPALKDRPSPSLEEPLFPAYEEPLINVLKEPPIPVLEESPSPALMDGPSPALMDGPSPAAPVAVAFHYSRLGEPLVFSSVVKFAFDVMDLVSELSNFHVRLRLRRPTFHPRLKDLMTADMRVLFERHQAIANNVHLLQIILNLPSPNNRTQLEYMIRWVMPWYRSVPFTTELFVEFCFMISFWTIVIRETNHWNGAPQVALEMIIHLTRGVLNGGGFGVCDRWPTDEGVEG